MKKSIRILRQYLRYYFGNRLMIQLPYRKNNVTNRSNICIEGYPRSANSWFNRYFKRSNPNSNIAHHIHLLSQVVKALKYNIPTVVLIRNPLDCISSLHVFNNGETSLNLEIIEYITYYTHINKIKGKLVLVKFETAIQNPHRAVQAINDKYNLLFNVGDKGIISKIRNEYKTEKSQKNINKTPTPAKERTKIKEKIMEPIIKNSQYKTASDLYNLLIKDAI